MKFGKLLVKTSDDMPEMHELFLRYKLLKKLLKSIPNKEDGEQASAPAAGEDAGAAPAGLEAQASPLSAGELEFIKMLNEDLTRFNQFFIDKEEDAVIRLQMFADQLQAATDQEQLQQLKTTLVHFHGEMVLMLHWSLLNYAAVVKILKKHDKRTGLLLRAPYLSNVLQQPFYSTSIMSRLVKRAEDLAQLSLAVLPHPSGGADGGAATTSSGDASTIHHQVSGAGGGSGGGGEHLRQLQQQAQLLAQLQASAATIRDAATGGAAEELAAATDGLERQNADVTMFRKTRMALETWALLGRTASTPSTVLPADAHLGGAAASDLAAVADCSVTQVAGTSRGTGSVIQAGVGSRRASDNGSLGTAAPAPPSAPGQQLSGGAAAALARRDGAAVEEQEGSVGAAGGADSSAGRKRTRDEVGGEAGDADGHVGGQ